MLVNQAAVHHQHAVAIHVAVLVADVAQAAIALSEILTTDDWNQAKFKQRAAVT